MNERKRMLHFFFFPEILLKDNDSLSKAIWDKAPIHNTFSQQMNNALPRWSSKSIQCTVEHKNEQVASLYILQSNSIDATPQGASPV